MLVSRDVEPDAAVLYSHVLHTKSRFLQRWGGFFAQSVLREPGTNQVSFTEVFNLAQRV